MPDCLYIHIPFCVRKCIYCDFFSVPHDESGAGAYCDALCAELALKRDQSRELKAVYIGGGTPSLLPEEQLSEILGCIRANYILSPAAEITVEANPGALSRDKLSALLQAGINRLSIGIQTFDDTELETLGRIHTARESVNMLETIKSTGIVNFSIDLMYGIPGQDMDSWERTINRALDFAPAHISGYELTPEEKTPLGHLIRSRKLEMPDEGLVVEMYNHVIDHLAGCGYEQYEISNFALPGYRCIHNINYWDRGGYIGAGAGAHSFVNGMRSRNMEDIGVYIRNIRNGVIPETGITGLSESDILREFIFLGLRKTDGISIIQAKELGLNISDAVRELENDGYIETQNGHLRLTRKGIILSNTIIVRLFEKMGL
jgi:oxygen-independent coproporphyrinogen-3 oxidase